MTAKKLLCTLLAIVIFSCGFLLPAEAKEVCISELTIATGKNGMTDLENKGYTVLFQGLNLISEENSMVSLGYKKGGEGITDIVVSNSKESTVSVKGITYNLVSDINLNIGTDGKPLYMYSTKDNKAGKGITGLDTVSGLSDKEEILPLKNDGSSPVRKTDGRLADFDEGIENNEIYLLMISAEAVRPYISDAVVVSGSTREDAVKSAADKGCDYYVDSNLKLSEGFTCIAYQRTPDKSDAITGIQMKGLELATEKQKDASTFLLDISDSALFSEKLTLSDWAEVYFAMSDTVSQSGTEYNSLTGSKEECSCVSISSASSLYGIFFGKAENIPKEITTAESTSATEEQTSELTDEFLDIQKEEQTTADENAEEEMNASSILGSGNIKNIVIFAVFIIAAMVGVFCFAKKGKRKN